MRIGLEFLSSSVDRPSARLIPPEDSSQPIGNFTGRLKQVHQVARARRTLDLEGIAVKEVVLQQRANQQRIDCIHVGPRQLDFPPICGCRTLPEDSSHDSPRR